MAESRPRGCCTGGARRTATARGGRVTALETGTRPLRGDIKLVRKGYKVADMVLVCEVGAYLASFQYGDHRGTIILYPECASHQFEFIDGEGLEGLLG